MRKQHVNCESIRVIRTKTLVKVHSKHPLKKKKNCENHSLKYITKPT